MKTMKSKDGFISRVKENDVQSFLDKDYVYVPKHEWKKLRDIKKQEKEDKKETKKNEKTGK